MYYTISKAKGIVAFQKENCGWVLEKRRLKNRNEQGIFCLQTLIVNIECAVCILFSGVDFFQIFCMRDFLKKKKIVSVSPFLTGDSYPIENTKYLYFQYFAFTNCKYMYNHFLMNAMHMGTVCV